MRRYALLFLLVLALLLPSLAHAEDSPHYAVVDRSANLRGGPGKQYPIVGSIAAGSRVLVFRSVPGQEVIAGITAWYDLGQNRYLYSEVAALESTPAAVPEQPAAPAAPAGTIAENSVGVVQTSLNGANMRAGPGRSFAVVGMVSNGSRIVIASMEHGQAILPGNDLWYKIGDNQYLYSDVVTLTGEKSNGQPQAAPPAATPGTTPASVPAATPAAASNIAPMPEQKSGVVTTAAAGVNLRAAPTTSSELAGILMAGAVIEVKAAVYGEEVAAGNKVWYDLGGKYIYSGLVKLGVSPGQAAPSGAPNVAEGWTLIAQDTTSFANSDLARIVNIRISNASIDGVTIPAGARFSINATLGNVDAGHGYKISQGIYGGEIVPSMGGGICQTATTLYRAAFYAGLPINQRVNHSLRLHWYEDEPGMDAAISDGWPDLVFTNDTARPILIRAYFNEQNATQTVQLYSTAPLNRTVHKEGPFGGWNSVTNNRVIQYADGRTVREVFRSYYLR